jgi:hypothetical protein
MGMIEASRPPWCDEYLQDFARATKAREGSCRLAAQLEPSARAR